ncbi:hypothetical protein INT47_011039 [Mucor saturninus]|uniref:Uncharacterized protein n=1 Tax=Mucor saturninus TaxID=64648 RepID=A0A8H7VC15_9FUNG|nr:hypothetical protein INT47_011039 [Mucor saturninus]
MLAEDCIDEFVSHFLANELKPKPRTEMNEKAVEFIQDASVDLIDNVLLNMVNSHTEGEGSFDWEFTMGNLLSLGLPTCVTDRVKRRMESTTGKNVPAITAMMVTRPSLSDLTITSAEVEMKKEIEKLILKNERFESLPEDQPFEDSLKWLMGLDKKDQCAKDKEIEKVHQDYTTRILDYKPAFF